MTTPSTKAKASRSPLPSGVEVLGEITPAFSEILTPEALAFFAKLQRQFGTRRKQCLDHRQQRQRRLDQGEGLDFLPETKQIREGDWKCAPIPSDIQDRRVEITAPTDRIPNVDNHSNYVKDVSAHCRRLIPDRACDG
jgi:malate synthase